MNINASAIELFNFNQLIDFYTIPTGNHWNVYLENIISALSTCIFLTLNIYLH